MVSPLHRWWLPRFSLRFLLAAVSTFGIGFPIWYRWPYEERTEQTVATCGFAFGPVVTTWQRQWGGGRLKQGWQMSYDLSNKLDNRSYYRLGQRDGPYEVFDHAGRVCLRGQYSGNAPVGGWTASEDSWSSRWEYRDGKRHGEFVYTSPSDELRLQFDSGRLVTVNGEPAKLDANAAALQVLGERLDSQPPIDGLFVETPLQEAAAFLSAVNSVTFFASPELHSQAPISYAAPHFELTLREELTVITQVHGLALRERYGGICFTTPDDNGPWHDPTGIGDLALPPDSPWRIAWERRAFVDAEGLSLHAALAKVLTPLDLPFDASRIEPRPFWLTTRLHPLRDVLAVLFYQSGCRCELVDGSLVIVPGP